MLGLELELDARGQEGKPLEQTLDVGIGDLHPFHAEARGDLRELLRELGADLAQMGELVAVETEQARIHVGRLVSRSRRSDRSRGRHSRHVAHFHLSRLEVELRSQQDLERNGL